MAPDAEAYRRKCDFSKIQSGHDAHCAGDSGQVITVGGYQVSNNSMYADSGRGYTVAGEIKPDFAAPAVSVYGPGLRQNYVTYTGTSAAAAVTAGAVAQIVGAGAAERSSDVQRRDQKYAHPRCKALGGQRVPNREWGYGALDVYQAFEYLRL